MEEEGEMSLLRKQEETNYVSPLPLTRRAKLKSWLFPRRHCSLPDAPSTYKDVIHIRTVSMLSWLDRLRVFFAGKIVVETRTVTENEIGENVTSSVFYVDV